MYVIVIVFLFHIFMIYGAYIKDHSSKGSEICQLSQCSARTAPNGASIAAHGIPEATGICSACYEQLMLIINWYKAYHKNNAKGFIGLPR